MKIKAKSSTGHTFDANFITKYTSNEKNNANFKQMSEMIKLHQSELNEKNNQN